MRPADPARPRLRKREIALAVALGGLAAGGAAVVLELNEDENRRVERVERAAPTERERTFELRDFDEIATSGPQDVVVTIGETFSVRSEGRPEALALLEPMVINGRLTIEPRNGFNWGNWRRLSGATFYVTMPKLEAVAVAGSGDVRVDRIEGESFEASIAGSGELSIATMRVDEADFNIGGSGNVNASGTAGETKVSILGSGKVRAGGLRSQSASVSIGGSGDVALTADEDVRVSIAGSGDVDISGTARCSVTRMGRGEVRCAGGGGTNE